ncbi:TPA: transposase [Candidatus Woesearchaeota archaeon]|nr:transposase [Candidatus Woesearchaeota archaeon]
MWHYFQYNKEQFLEHYHKRSNSETVFHMVKSKFGDAVRSKTWMAQQNEISCKILCHDICCVIQEMHELGITPNFCVESQTPVCEGGEIKD